jgi:hypothetical protein
MARTIKTSKKFLKEADVPEYTEDITSNQEAEEKIRIHLKEEEDDDNNDEPESVSISTSKAEIITQIKSEREARRLDRELKRQKNVSLQEQNRQAHLRRLEKIEAEKDEISDEEEESEKIMPDPSGSALCPLPENIFETAIHQKKQQQKL